ncbi:hypothetical protein A9Z42_0017570 [Trichoderma parareesei]|uniref:Beta-lactamase-related domain-containing protein n=1 Tax=Trichoderma parareesei TaxID=858221 RepID=A0A2H2ZGT8_TRIPA|nr:hypothetical protein A9Z42_0017570 [Trichoderma parareesei]
MIVMARPMTPQTLFEIGSASMLLTAAAVALLNTDSRCPEVRYNAEMAELLPEQFVMPDNMHDGVTVEDILSHRTGMAPNDDAHISFDDTHGDDARSVTLNVRNLSTSAPLQSRYLPCNLMYTVASYLVERKSGMAFADFLDQRMFQPLGMTRTNMWLDRAWRKGLGGSICPGYSWDPTIALTRLRVRQSRARAPSSPTSTTTSSLGPFIFGNMESADAAGELLMQDFLDELLDVPQQQRLTQDQTIQQLSRSGLCSAFTIMAFTSKVNGQSEAGAASPGAETSEQSRGQGSLAQKIPLRNYLGEFWNPGWRGINVTVGVEEGQLTTYVAQKQYRVGVMLEPELRGYVWFERAVRR